ncbi:MAG TPA: asparagine synthase (glutamine-hydrolyzing) [Blastocatellia bacterium]|nr:asparagine synthase (glutamine-hydrolyzing) [Blastocatellia bacterium]
MCGIVGEVSSNGRPVNERVVERMCAAIVHRGPDDEGYYFNPGLETGSGSHPQGTASVGLGMRRLAIIDLNTGHQPIHNEDKSAWVVLNGEIYNYTELRADLESKGHLFYTHSDTEAIVHAYEEYGCDVPKYLHGMFAFAVWDERKQRLLLARDRVGKKPLLYSITGGKLVFASEFQAILCHPDVPREVNREAISDYLSFMCVPAPHTAFRAVRKLEPGHTLVWQGGAAKVERYWSLDFRNKVDLSEEEAGRRSIELLREAVGARLMSDVPLGAFLSGGIDSSAVVALMSELSSVPVKTFSIGFEEQDFSELEHARRVARAFGTDHHEFVVRPDAIEVLPTLVRHYGEPYADSSAIPTYYLSKMARASVTVALNGDGGDECFAGYERYAAMKIAERYDRLPRLLRKQVVEPAIRAIPAAGATRSRLGKARRFLDVMSRPVGERYLRWTSVINEEMKAELFTKDFLTQTASASALRHVRPWFIGNGEIDVIDRALMADTYNYLPNDLLVKVDIASMAVSLEARSPFLDHRVMEFAASLPANYKLRGVTTKYLLKHALRGLVPEENLTRRKMGFGVPINHWLRNDLKGFLEDNILSDRAIKRGYFKPEAVRHLVDQHAIGRRDFSHHLWTLLMLELWHKEFVD